MPSPPPAARPAGLLPAPEFCPTSFREMAERFVAFLFASSHRLYRPTSLMPYQWRGEDNLWVGAASGQQVTSSGPLCTHTLAVGRTYFGGRSRDTLHWYIIWVGYIIYIFVGCSPPADIRFYRPFSFFLKATHTVGRLFRRSRIVFGRPWPSVSSWPTVGTPRGLAFSDRNQIARRERRWILPVKTHA